MSMSSSDGPSLVLTSTCILFHSGPCSSLPSRHLKKQLIDYEKHLFGKTSFQTVDEFRDFQVQLTPQIGNGKETKENEEEEQDVIPPNKEGIKENPEESPLQ